MYVAENGAKNMAKPVHWPGRKLFSLWCTAPWPTRAAPAAATDSRSSEWAPALFEYSYMFRGAKCRQTRGSALHVCLTAELPSTL